MYTITDLNDFEIQISDGFKDVVIWKQNIRFGGIDGDILTLYWHNRAQTETRYELELDYNLVTVPAVASAAALQSAIEAMIISGWGGTGGIALAAGGVTASTGTVVFSNANSVTFGMAGNTVTASFSAPAGSNSSWSLSAGTQSATVSALTFADSNGVSFGLNNGTVTASHNGLTSQSVQPVAVSGSNGSFTFSTLTMGNLNGLSLYTSNGSIVGSYTVPTQSTQPVAFSGSNGSFSYNTITFGNLNGASFYSSNGSAVLSYTVPSVTNSSWTASAGTQSATISQLVFSDSNGVSFGLNNGTLTASHNGLTSQSSQVINISATAATTLFATSGSAYNLFISGDGDIQVGVSNNTIHIGHAKNTHTFSAANGSFGYEQLNAFNSNGVSFSTTVSGGSSGFIGSHNGLTSQSNQALSGSNGSFTFQTATFGNLNGVSFYTSNGSLVASHNGLTSQSVQPVAISGSNGSFSFGTVTFGNLNGLSFYTSNGSLVGSYTVPAGGSPAISVSNGSFTYNTVTFGNLNGASFYSSNGSVVLSYSVPADGGITASQWPDTPPLAGAAAMANNGTTGNTGGSTQVSGSIFLGSYVFNNPVVFDNLYGFNIHQTSAGTGSATLGHAIGIYTVNANTALSLVSSFHWQIHVSQNSVTAKTYRWFWGNNSNANSTQTNGNISTNFTNIKRIVMFTSNGASFPAGNYYIASIMTARTSGIDAFSCSNAVYNQSGINSIHTPIGSAVPSSMGGFIGAVSSTFNMSDIAGLQMPNAIATANISLQPAAIRLPVIYMERSKS